VLVVVGRAGFGALAGRHRQIIDQFSQWRDVLAHLDDIIHPEVHKIYAGAKAPVFLARPEADAMILEYRSSRGLCRLAEGLARGATDWFGAVTEVEHRRCTHHGDPACELVVRERA
jgi:hypothetical protein